MRYVSLDFNKFLFKKDFSYNQLDLGLDLDYDIEEQKETEFQKRLKVYKLKYAKRFKVIKYSFLYYNL